MSPDVSLGEVMEVVRLVREVCERWDDPRAWREHLLHGACRILGGNVGMLLTEAECRPGRFGKLRVSSVVGVSPAMRLLVRPALSKLDRRGFDDAAEQVMPGTVALYDQIVRCGWVTASRDQVTDAATYHAAPHYLDFRKGLDCDDFVVSIRLVDLARRAEAISVDRPHGAAPFGAREVALLTLLHDEIAPLIGVRLATEDHLSRDGLSARVRQTLSLLLTGSSEKEVAAAMGLGGRTVHDYVTMLYAHFEVSSRAELLAYFIRREPVARAARGPGLADA